MQIIHSIQELDRALASRGKVAFVPTMGNFHEGHLALVDIAGEQGDCVVASIFVNPLQFGPGEDFEKYPRTLAADSEKLALRGCDIVFAPAVDEMYPNKLETYVEPPPISTELCGAFRPGHFKGVATVVLKLLNIVQPHVAVFGKKDYQQLHIIKTMVMDLNVPVRIVGGETSRADDGLALSSRNGYLSQSERAEAPRLYRLLSMVAEGIKAGQWSYSGLEESAAQDLESNGWNVDYISVRDAQTLMTPNPASKQLVVLGAAWLGATRLIDNIEVCIDMPESL